MDIAKDSFWLRYIVIGERLCWYEFFDLMFSQIVLSIKYLVVSCDVFDGLYLFIGFGLALSVALYAICGLDR